jgi:hypothetical protein
MLDYLDDIASDLSVFHRIDDPYLLDGPRYFRLAWRLAAYQGVMQARVAAEQRASEPQQRPFEYGAPADINPGTKTTLQADPAFAGVFSFGTPGP